MKGNDELNQFEDLIQGLIEQKYGCSDDFIEPDTVAALRQNIQSHRDSKEWHSGGLGNKTNYQQNNLIRGDKIKWIEEQSKNEHEALFLKKIGHFISHLNISCYTSIHQFECHYASYELGSFYKKHLDQFKTDKGRKFSLILYLNENWQNEDGGRLSLYPKGEQPIDISPIGGRMVFFRSDEMEHEVHPSFTRERVSIAGWLKN